MAQLGWLPGCAPPSSCTAAHPRLEEVPDFIVTTENISVINILLVLNPKHSSYLEEN